MINLMNAERADKFDFVTESTHSGFLVGIPRDSGFVRINSFHNGHVSGYGYVAVMTPFGGCIARLDYFDGISDFAPVPRHGNAYSGRIGDSWYPFIAEIANRFGVPVWTKDGLLSTVDIHHDYEQWRRRRAAAIPQANRRPAPPAVSPRIVGGTRRRRNARRRVNR